MKCNCVVSNRNISKLKTLLPKKKAISLLTVTSLLPITTVPLLNTDKLSDINSKELDTLFKNALDEICNGKPRFDEDGKQFLNKLYKKCPQLIFQMISAENEGIKKQAQQYRFSPWDIGRILQKASIEDLNSFNNINPNILQDILSNNTIPQNFLFNILKLASKHPEEYLKMKESGVFTSINSGNIDANILGRINQNLYLSEEYLNSIENKESIITLPADSNFEELDNIIEEGQVYQIKDELFMNFANKKYYMKLEISPDKFIDLFGDNHDYSIKQGKIGDCWLLSAIDSLMATSSGKSFIFHMFEQDGNDILVKFPKSKQKIRFKNGELGNADSKTIAPKGIKMLEQAYAIHLQNKRSKDNNEIVVQETKELDNTLSVLNGGHTQKGIKEFLGNFSSHVLGLRESFKMLYNSIKFRFINKKNKKEITRYIENIKKYANDDNKIVSISFCNSDNTKKQEKLILPEYDLFANHAYCVKKYNKKAGTVVLSNPHDTRYSIEIPLSIISKYIINCDIIAYCL